MIPAGAQRRVAITGVGAVGTAFTGGSAALGAALSDPHTRLGGLAAGALAEVTDGLDTRRLSRVCQLAVAAARLALRDAGGDALAPGDAGGDSPASGEGGDDSLAPLGVVVGTELGDLRSTRDFADGYRARGPAGLSALLFPGTVMNTMAAATSIALQTPALSLTINAPGIPGELAVARAAASIAAGQATRLLAGAVDELDPWVVEILERMGVEARGRGEGAAFLVLEALDEARARGGRVLGEILGVATGGLPARPLGVGRSTHSRVVAAAIERAGGRVQDVGWVYASAGRDARLDAWERAVLEAGLAPHRPPRAVLGRVWGQHSGLGVLGVAAAAWTARSGLLPARATANETSGSRPGLTRVSPGLGVVHGLARGGGQAAIVVGPPPA